MLDVKSSFTVFLWIFLLSFFLHSAIWLMSPEVPGFYVYFWGECISPKILIISSDKPDTPVLTTDTSDVTTTDGDDIPLTCTSTTPGISMYQFYKGVTSLVTSPSNVYNITQATIDRDDGVYTCVVYIHGVGVDNITVTSQHSRDFHLRCETSLIFVHLFIITLEWRLYFRFLLSHQTVIGWLQK